MMMKLLLLQARRGADPMAAKETQSFVRSAGLEAEQVTVHDLCEGPPTLKTLRRYDALLLGGSGEFYVSKANLPHYETFLDLLRELVAAKLPTFASCYGFQSLAHAHGGKVIHDPDNTELGTYLLTRTDDALPDPLFGELPAQYMTQMGHKDRVTVLPAGWPNFATSALCPLQATRVPGAPIWAAQFHPELDRADNVERYTAYLATYAEYMSREELDEALSRFTESPEAYTLLQRFLAQVGG